VNANEGARVDVKADFLVSHKRGGNVRQVAGTMWLKRKNKAGGTRLEKGGAMKRRDAVALKKSTVRLSELHKTQPIG
jgi:hypothetical protein